MSRSSIGSVSLLRLTPLALALIAAPSYAAQRVELSQQDINQLNSRYQSLVGTQGKATMAHTRHAQLLNLDGESRLLLRQRNTVEDGARANRYVQTFRGLPIYNGQLVVREDSNGVVSGLYGVKVDGLQSEIPATAVRLQPSAALRIAKQHVFGLDAGWALTEGDSARQMIWLDDGNRGHRVYVVRFSAGKGPQGEPISPLVIVDADSGKVLKYRDDMRHEQIGTGPGGNSKTGQYEYGTDFGFLDVTKSGTTCSMENSKVKTINLNHAYTRTGPAHSFTCPRNTVKTINGAYSPLNDAHYFGNVVFDMYSAYMNAAPLTVKLSVGVHYGNNYENATWDPATSTMVFGDGLNTFYPLVSLDVLSHEVSHGYTQQNSDLDYDTGHPGGMNEAFSDIAGEAAEFFSRGTNDFLVGAQIFKASSGALRYMCNPTQDGVSIDRASNMPAGGMNNHYSSGVYNKAFCQLAKKSGWDTKSAFQAFARANRDYWTSTSSWGQGACGVQRAAADMGKNVQDVVSAFQVVGVTASGNNCGGGSSTNTPPVANFTSSANGLTVQFTDTSTDSDGSIASRSWAFGDGSTSTAANPSKTYSTAGTYTVSLTVTDDKGASTTKSSSITVSGGSTGGTVLGNNVPVTGLSAATGASLSYTMVVPAGATNLSFSSSGGSGDADMYVRFGSAPTDSAYDCRPYKSGNAETCNFATPQAGTYHVRLKAYSAFSNVSLVGKYTTGGGGGDPVLGNNTPVSGISGAASSTQYWQITVPASASKLTVTLSGGSGDADLYVRKGSRPTTSTYTCRSWNSGNSETCGISAPGAATYYVMVRGYSAFSGATLKASY